MKGLPFVNGRYTKSWKMVYKRLRGGSPPYKSLLSTPIPPPPPAAPPGCYVSMTLGPACNAPINVMRGGGRSQGMGWGFDCLFWRKRLRPNICFPLPRVTHVPYGLERFGNHGDQREQAKAWWISLFCRQISFVLACSRSIEPLKILWYQSKRK